MVHELNRADYKTVQTLLRPMAGYLTFCAAVLEGSQAGRVFVDDPIEPRTAFMNTRGSWSYLAGDPSNAAFNRALNKAIFAREVVGEDAFGLLLHCHPEGWQAVLRDVCHPRQPIEIVRRRYICRDFEYDWTAEVPEGYTLQLVDRSLLERAPLDVPEDVKNLIEAWGPADEEPSATGDSVAKGFGFVALQDDQIVAHAVVDCVAGGVGDIGLVTAEDHRRRGLGTVTAGAAVAFGLSRGLAMINWDCANTNLGSIRTAEKLGFEHERDHRMYFIGFDKLGHAINLAWHSLEAGCYQDTIDAIEPVIAEEKRPPAYALFPAACAWAGLGHREKAFQYLSHAIDRGWDSLHETLDAKAFERFHDLPEWAEALARIQHNRQQRDAG